jgi:hypothetical protein
LPNKPRCGDYRGHVNGDRIADLQLRDGRLTRRLGRFDRVDAATIVVDDIDAILDIDPYGRRSRLH